MVHSFKSAWRTYNIHLENIRENEKKDETKKRLTCLDNQLSGCTIKKHRENHFFLRLDVRGKVEEGREIKSKLFDH